MADVEKAYEGTLGMKIDIWTFAYALLKCTVQVLLKNI